MSEKNELKQNNETEQVRIRIPDFGPEVDTVILSVPPHHSKLIYVPIPASRLIPDPGEMREEI